MNEEKVLLPQTNEEFDTFVNSLITEYNLPKTDQTTYSIAEMIAHLPNTQAYAAPSYFAHGVLRGVAHRIAFNKIEEVKERLIAQDKAERDAKEKSKLTLVDNGTSSTDEQPLQNA